MNVQAVFCWTRRPRGEFFAGRKDTAMRHTKGLHTRSCVTIISDRVWSHPWIKCYYPDYSFRRIKECSSSSNASIPHSGRNRYGQIQVRLCIPDPRHAINREWLFACQNSRFFRIQSIICITIVLGKKIVIPDFFNLFYFKWICNRID